MANAKKPDRRYVPFIDEVLGDHLRASHHVGLYPLLHGDTCRLLACDFDGDRWVLDALAYVRAATDEGVPATLERFRSGQGGHVWVFFEDLVPASLARRLGVHLLRRATDDRAMDGWTYAGHRAFGIPGAPSDRAFDVHPPEGFRARVLARTASV